MYRIINDTFVEVTAIYKLAPQNMDEDTDPYVLQARIDEIEPTVTKRRIIRSDVYGLDEASEKEKDDLGYDGIQIMYVNGVNPMYVMMEEDEIDEFLSHVGPTSKPATFFLTAGGDDGDTEELPD
jgi:hypothetical protein